MEIIPAMKQGDSEIAMLEASDGSRRRQSFAKWEEKEIWDDALEFHINKKL